MGNIEDLAKSSSSEDEPQHRDNDAEDDKKSVSAGGVGGREAPPPRLQPDEEKWFDFEKASASATKSEKQVLGRMQLVLEALTNQCQEYLDAVVALPPDQQEELKNDLRIVTSRNMWLGAVLTGSSSAGTSLSNLIKQQQALQCQSEKYEKSSASSAATASSVRAEVLSQARYNIHLL